MNNKIGTKEFDLVGYIMDYESGEISDERILEMMSHLIKTGLAWTLQGHYGRTAKQLIDGGYISKDGEILIDIDKPADSDFCPDCEQHYFSHNDDGSCVED